MQAATAIRCEISDRRRAWRQCRELEKSSSEPLPEPRGLRRLDEPLPDPEPLPAAVIEPEPAVGSIATPASTAAVGSTATTDPDPDPDPVPDPEPDVAANPPHRRTGCGPYFGRPGAVHARNTEPRVLPFTRRKRQRWHRLSGNGVITVAA